MVRGLGWSVLMALALASIAAPTAIGSHCETKINVYGRVSPAPLSPPPYSSATAGICVRVLDGSGIDEHVLPPNTSEVMVRVAGDFGPSVPSIGVEFDGLGFDDVHGRLYRTPNPAGGFTYNLPEWLQLPDGPQSGELMVTITQPGGVQRSIAYHTTLTVVPPGVPPLPPL